MCGIAGKISFTSQSLRLSDLNRLSTAIAHRGPDDSGLYLSPNRRVGLVHRRLSIIDLSSAGHQPMSYQNRYWITFNGEIYNYQEQKTRLIKKGFRFRSNSDTEVLLALYAAHGTDCLQYLRGMFAFAIYDPQKQTLFIARDRLGKKPLKYFSRKGVFIFASELKALLTQPEVHVRPDWSAINHYLTYGYVPSPQTGFTHIQKLPPAHYLIINTKTGELSQHRYWQPDYTVKWHLSEDEWAEKIMSQLTTSVRLRMISDVPIGLFLSGGSDSSIIAAIMAQYSSKPINTFTIAFNEPDFDESPHAARISNLFHTNHTVFTVQPQDLSLLPELARQYEEPYGNSSAVITYLISRLARAHVKVVLNGDGGDENFAGYDRYLKLRRDIFLYSLRPYTTPLVSPLSHLWPKFHRLWSSLSLGWMEKFVSYNSNFLYPDKIHLYTPQFLKFIGTTRSPTIFSHKMDTAPAPDSPDKALYADLTTYFPDDLLTKVDIASMAVGLEARSPLADHQLTELACHIPFSTKIRHHTLKYIFKKTLASRLPPENIFRPKMGFSLPLRHWFSKELNSYAKGLLLARNSHTRALFDRDYIREMLTNHTAQNDFGPRLYLLLMLELWFQSYFT